jgi:gliding motility-associated-like protein
MRKPEFSPKMAALLSLSIGLIVTNQVEAQLLINEYCAANKDAFATSVEQIQDRGSNISKTKYEDWVELYNNSNSAISLQGYALSDNAAKPNKYLFPANLSIPAKGKMLFVCSGKNGYFGNYHHTNFKLNQTGGKDVIVLSKNGEIIDSIRVLPAMKNHSRGRINDGAANWGVFEVATPNVTNMNAKQRYLSAPVCNVNAGFYGGSTTIEFTSTETDGTIFYTTDGTDPIKSSSAKQYLSPINVSKTTAIRACVRPAANANTIASQVVTNTYFINENHVLPVISLCSSDFGNLFQFMKPNIEIAGSMEFFDKNKVRQFKVEGGIKGHGNDSWYYEQKGMRFYARDEFGDASKINYPLFSSSERTKYDCVILRAAGSDNYVGFADASPSTHIRDGFAQTLAEKGNLNLDTRKYEAVIVYLNGTYWGVYELRERVDDKFTKAYYNEGKEGVDMLSYYGGLSVENDASGKAQQDWCNLYQFVKNNDMKIDANYNQVAAQLDVMSLIDYFCLNTFMVNSDWLNWNTAWWRGKNATNGKWRYRLWDEDNIFNLGQNFSNIPSMDAETANACDVQSVSSFQDAGCGQGHVDIFNALMNNHSFRNLYINRYADLLNTTLSKNNMLNHLNAMIADIQPEMQRHCERWDAGNAHSYQTWMNNVNYLRSQIAARANKTYASMDTCYNATPVSGIVVNVTPAQSGNVVVNTVMPASYPVALTYFKNLEVNFSASANTGFKFSHWTVKNQVLANNESASIKLAFTAGDTLVAVFVEDKPIANVYDSIRTKNLNGVDIKTLAPVKADEDDKDELTAHIEKEEEENKFENAPGRTAFHKIIVPSVFTPNGDGNNDVLYVLGASLSNFQFAVYNIAGQLVFSSNNQSEGWNGTISGSPAPVGTYVYFVSGLLENDSRVFTNSTFTLLR